MPNPTGSHPHGPASCWRTCPPRSEAEEGASGRFQPAPLPRSGHLPRRLKSFALPPDMLAQQHAAQLLKLGWRIVTRPKNRLRVVDRQREHTHHPPERILKPASQVGVVNQSSEIQHELIANWETGDVHPFDRDRTYVRVQPGLGGSYDAQPPRLPSGGRVELDDVVVEACCVLGAIPGRRLAQLAPGCRSQPPGRRSRCRVSTAADSSARASARRSQRSPKCSTSPRSRRTPRATPRSSSRPDDTEEVNPPTAAHVEAHSRRYPPPTVSPCSCSTRPGCG
jgi:hypothetical protein